MAMRLWLPALLVLLASGVADARERGPEASRAERRGDSEGGSRAGGGRRHFTANPTALVAAEIELKQLARKDGQWKALLDSAAPGAELFVPQRVAAEEWLKGRDEPDSLASWQPLEVWMSCDGSYGVVRGSWRQADAAGPFVALWQRQEDRSYKWLLGKGSTRDEAPGDADMIAAHVADCSASRAASASLPAAGDARRSGESADGSLQWSEGMTADGSWSFVLQIWDGTSYPVAFRFEAPAAPSGE